MTALTIAVSFAVGLVWFQRQGRLSMFWHAAEGQYTIGGSTPGRGYEGSKGGPASPLLPGSHTTHVPYPFTTPSNISPPSQAPGGYLNPSNLGVKPSTVSPPSRAPGGYLNPENW